MKIFYREPVLWLGLFVALLVAISTFGFALADEQLGIMLAVALCASVLRTVSKSNVNDWSTKIRACIAAIRFLPAAPTGECVWTEKAACYWTTTCGHDFSDDDGISFKWCGYCGGKLIEIKKRWAPDDKGPDR